MHLAFATRGPINEVEDFIKELSTRYLEFDWYNQETKKLERRMIKGRLCPIQLWDFSFPSQHLDAVLTTCLGAAKGKPQMRSHKKFVWTLRKAMHFEKIPEYKTDMHLAMSDPKGIELIGIGIKEDYWITENNKHVDKGNKTGLSYEGI